MKHHTRRHTAFLQAHPGARQVERGKDRGAPKVDRQEPPADATRRGQSHVNGDGSAKRVYMSEAEAIRHAEVQGRRLSPYRCWMKPEHWHIGRVKEEP